MEFPTILYRTPGPHQGNGCSWDYIGAESDSEVSRLLGGGWFLTLPEAIEGKAKALAADELPTTREELEAKAADIGLKFDGRTSDARLLERITEALNAKG